MLHRYQNMFKVNIMRKISKADLSLRNLKKLIKKEFNETDKLIRNQINSDVNRIPKLSKHIINLGGKRLRPMLTISCAKMLKVRNKNHIKLAAAVELLHTATLLHDDVVDESNYRRGEKTSHTLWDNKSSILVGDFLLGKAFQLMVETNSLECLNILSKAASIIAEGEDNGKYFRLNIGSGFTDIQRQNFWNNKEKLIGKIVEVRADSISKSKDGDLWSLRFPRFKTFRGFDKNEKI